LLKEASAVSPDKRSLTRIADEVRFDCAEAANAGYDLDKLQEHVRARTRPAPTPKTPTTLVRKSVPVKTPMASAVSTKNGAKSPIPTATKPIQAPSTKAAPAKKSAVKAKAKPAPSKPPKK
jgi:hypothetical protein